MLSSVSSGRYARRGPGRVSLLLPNTSNVTFEVFGNNSETRPGPRRAYRPLDTLESMTDAELKDQVINHAHAFGDGKGSGAAGMGGYKAEQVTHFAGKKLTVRMDSG